MYDRKHTHTGSGYNNAFVGGEGSAVMAGMYQRQDKQLIISGRVRRGNGQLRTP